MTSNSVLQEILRREERVLEPSVNWSGEADFGDPAAEYEAITAHAGLVDAGLRTQIELSGDDALSFLNRLSTNKLNDLQPGSGCETFLTNARGRIVAYIQVFVRDHSVVLSTAGAQAEKLLDHLDYYLIREGVRLHNRQGQWSLLLLAGARSPEVLVKLTPIPLPSASLAHVDVRLAGIPVTIRRVDMAGPTGFLLSIKADDAGRVEQALCSAGAARCGWLAAETVRLESGSPEYGRDITEENFPQEVGRVERTVSYTKGCYLGQETVARIESRGHVNQTLVGLKFADAEVPRAGSELFAGSEPRGRVTSAVYSPRLESALALGYVRRGHDRPGSRLESALGAVEVVKLPVNGE